MFCLDTMDNWDEKKLEEVVNKKHGEAEKKKAKTQIVSLLGGWIIKTGQRLIVDKEHLFSEKTLRDANWLFSGPWLKNLQAEQISHFLHT